VSSHAGPRDWDAAVYDRVSQPQAEWAQDVLARLPLEGDETVLDAGCGTGSVTADLLQRVPRGRVIAVDASPSMVERARERLGAGADVRLADLVDLRLDERVDVVFSNAVFHWIADHERLFARLHATLAPGGRLVAQCGGLGNVAALGGAIGRAAARPQFAPHLAGFEGMWNFAGPEETSERLSRAGFTDVRCWLEPKHVRPDRPHDYLVAVTLGPHLARMPGELRDPFVDAVAAEAGEPLELDYVRLNIAAVLVPA